MDDTKFIALMSDSNADFNIIVSKDNLTAFADHLISHFRLELEAKAEQTRQQQDDDETFFSRKEASAYLGVCETTLWKWAKPDCGYLLPVRVGARVKYRKSDLDRVKLGRQREEPG